MIKTEKNIERDVYNIVCDSELRTTINGSVYRKGMRPINATTEDIVVKFLAGLDAQVQLGVVIINIYVPDIEIAGRSKKVENIQRVELFQSLLNELLETLENTEYDFEKDGTLTSIDMEDIEQHCINIRLKFKQSLRNALIYG